jgi:hypothetical protein
VRLVSAHRAHSQVASSAASASRGAPLPAAELSSLGARLRDAFFGFVVDILAGKLDGIRRSIPRD